MTLEFICALLTCAASGFTLGLMVGRAEGAKAKRECAEWRAEALLHVGANIARGHACPYCHGEIRMMLVGKDGERVMAAYCPRCLPPGMKRA